MVTGERERAAVFVFYEDGSGVAGYGSLEELLGDIEAIDVSNGEYAFFRADGRVVEAVVKGRYAQDIDLRITEQDGSRALRERLMIALPKEGIDASLAGSPLAAVQALVEARWAARRPRRPEWLDRLVHGSRAVVDDG